MSARGLLVAAPRSGSGKTTVTLGLLAAFKARGLKVRAVKSGPDYIDPAFHAAATGEPGLNLDTWAMPPALLDGLAHEAATSADLLVAEAAMGLFDGIPDAPGRSGAPSDLAARLGLPVILVIDVSGQSQSAAATVRGFAGHDPAVKIAGVVLNRLGSERHRRLVGDAIEALGIPVVGALTRDATLSLPERHLGLVQAREHPDLAAHMERLRAVAELNLDLDAILSLAAPVRTQPGTDGPPLKPPGRRIALASDAAFGFVYPHVVAGWERAGAQIHPFSPLADEPPPADCDACWLPGGYPELHAAALASASRFKAGILAFAQDRPVHGECGGYMVLGERLEDAAGESFPMLGLLGHATSFARRGLNLGYREARLLADGVLGPKGARVHGHEFHYARVVAPGNDEPFADLCDGQGRALGPAGGRRGNVTGTFFHAIAAA